MKYKAAKDLNFEDGIILTDRFDNILLDSVDIIQALFPFYQFQVKDHYPLIKAILPYGWDGMRFVSQGNAKIQEFKKENDLIKLEFEEKVKQRIENANPQKTEEKGGVKKKQENLAEFIMYYLKRTGRMLYMITIIAAYWIVFVPRMKISDSLKFLNAVQIIENTVNSEMKSNQNFDFNAFSDYYFRTISSSDAITQNALLSKMAIFQRRYPSKDCFSYSKTTSKFIEDNKNKFKCSTVGVESKSSYGDSSEGFSYSDFKGLTFNTYGREYSTINGFYMFFDTANLTITHEKVVDKVNKGWVDKYTNYVGFILNLYQPNFQLLMVIVAIYDTRFGYDILVGSPNQDQ